MVKALLRAIAAVIAIAIVLAAPAAAAPPPEALLQFPASTGVGSAEMRLPRGVVANPLNGHIYAVEQSNLRVSEYTAWGVFVRAFGWGVLDGSSQPQICTVTCVSGAAGSAGGQLSNPQGVALDAAGNVYVADRNNLRVQRFSGSGQFQLAFGGDVTSSGPGNTGANEQQKATVKATGGSFSLTLVTAVGGGKTASGSSTVSGVFNTLGGYQVGDAITGTGIPANTTITAVGAGTLTLSANATATGSPELTARENTGATGVGTTANGSNTITGVVTRTGAFAVGERISITGSTVAAGTTIAAVGAGTLTLSNPVTAGGGAAKVLTATDIPFNASAAELQAALEALPGVGAAGVAVSGGPGNATGTTPYLVTFSGGQLKGNDVEAMTAATANLEGTKTVGIETPVPGGGAEICQPSAGDVCKKGVSGTGSGQFSSWPAFASLIAVGPENSVYVGDNNRIQKFNPSGAFEGEIPLPGKGQVEALALDSAANAYFVTQTENNLVRKVDSGGLEGPANDVGGQAAALAVDAQNKVYVAIGTSNPTIARYKPGGALDTTFGQGEFNTSTGLATAPNGDVYVANSNNANSYVRAYGPDPVVEPPPALAPTVGSQYAGSVGPGGAVLNATISPHFWSTRYYFEYGLVDCALGPCTKQPAPPGDLLLVTRGTTTASVTLTGLAPGTTYHYRVVASSAGGGPTLGADRTFTTPLVSGFTLPDGRVYEMVSPPEKNGAEVAVPRSAGGSLVGNAVPQQAAAAGNAVTYTSFTAFGDGTESSSIANQYRSQRSASGWATESISPRFEEGYLSSPVVGVSENLDFAAVIALESPLAETPLDPQAPVGFWNLYSQRNADRSLQVVNTAPPALTGPNQCVGFAGASAGFDRLILLANSEALRPGDPLVAGGNNLYEWTAAGGLQLASLLPDGSPATPAVGTGFGGGGAVNNFQSSCDVRQVLMHRAISADGSRVFWTYEGSYVGPLGPVSNPLLARVNGTATVQIDAPEGVPCAATCGGGKFWSASRSGSKVFFTSAAALTTDAVAGGDLYMYDFEAPEGDRLTDLAPGGEVQGVLGASEEGDFVYFTARGALDAGATAGQPNLYVWREGESPRFIATLPNVADNTNWSRNPNQQTARATPDGKHLAFVSTSRLTGFDNTVAGAPGCVLQVSGALAGSPQCAEVFLYGYDGDDLACASCSPTGAAPLGPATVPTWSTPYEQPRYLQNGGRLFFESLDSLSLHDTNGERDVYEFERAGVGDCAAGKATYSQAAGGCVSLISTGTSADDSFLLDASADGTDAFFSTRQALVPWDQDGRFDVYDGRVGGGLPPPAPSAPCSGEGCRPALAAPSAVAPSSPTFSGSGNLVAKPPKCKKGKVKRNGRCVAKKKPAAKKKSKQAQKRAHRAHNRTRKASR